MLQNNTECGTAFTSYYKADTSDSASFEAENNRQERLTKYELFDSGFGFVNLSPISAALVKGDKRELLLSNIGDETEEFKFTLVNGYLEPYEKNIIDCIGKFKFDGQLTENGDIYFTLGQLYRALRQGTGTVSPLKRQKEALLNKLYELSSSERNITFQVNDSLKAFCGFKSNVMCLPLIDFVTTNNRAKGKTDIIIIIKRALFMNDIAERLGMRELLEQKVMAVQDGHYTFTLLQPLKIDGREKRYFKFLDQNSRRVFCVEHGITGRNIESHCSKLKAWTLNESRIALRSVIIDFLLRYARTRRAGRNYSNKLPYKEIFRLCGISTKNRMEVRRAKNSIAVILSHLEGSGGLSMLKSWREYSNKGSKKPDGIEIFTFVPESFEVGC